MSRWRTAGLGVAETAMVINQSRPAMTAVVSLLQTLQPDFLDLAVLRQLLRLLLVVHREQRELLEHAARAARDGSR